MLVLLTQQGARLRQLAAAVDGWMADKVLCPSSRAAQRQAHLTCELRQLLREHKQLETKFAATNGGIKLLDPAVWADIEYRYLDVLRRDSQLEGTHIVLRTASAAGKKFPNLGYLTSELPASTLLV